MARVIGLLIVHGIGGQRLGELQSLMATALADRGTEPEWEPGVRTRNDDDDNANGSGVHPIRVNGSLVLVREANWAKLSDPDHNEPTVRFNQHLLVMFDEIVRATWNYARYAPMNSGAIGTQKRHNSRFLWPVLGAFLIALFLALGVPRVRDLIASIAESIQGYANWIAILPVGAFVAYLVFCIAKVIRQKRGQLLTLHVIAGFTYALSRWFFLVLRVIILMYLSVGLFVGYFLNIIGVLLSYLFRLFGRLVSGRGIWIRRIGWAMVVMPVQTFLQAIRSAMNLFSILFIEEGVLVRVVAFFGLFGVYLAFLGSLIFSEILWVVLVLAVVLSPVEGSSSLQSAIVVFVFVLPIYLLILKFSLRAIDLVLDISNYQLASSTDRQKYFAQVEKGIETLRSANCEEIHVLAHSLGSVIIYDWLWSRSQDTEPIAVLHTIGSPLNKFWYIDHNHAERVRDRNGLEPRVSRLWVNYWALSDPVSGSLNHYHSSELGVGNRRLRGLVSHTRYWRNAEVKEGILDCIRDAQKRS